MCECGVSAASGEVPVLSDFRYICASFSRAQARFSFLDCFNFLMPLSYNAYTRDSMERVDGDKEERTRV